MGIVESTRFKYALTRGDETTALKLYNNSKKIKFGLDASESYGERSGHNTPLHYASLHAMQGIISVFLNLHDGSPNACNWKRQTCLHSVCNLSVNKEAREQSLRLLLGWRGSPDGSKRVEIANVNAQDDMGNTPLHLAARSGLMECCQLLVINGAGLYLLNSRKWSPCDEASEKGHLELATYLEALMVLGGDEDERVAVEEILLLDGDKESHRGLKMTELQAEKDLLLVKTSDMLGVTLHVAEVLLKHYEWDDGSLVNDYVMDPVLTCSNAGVSLLEEGEEEAKAGADNVIVECVICGDEFASKEMASAGCEHSFCSGCWKDYFTVKIKDGDTEGIICPYHKCNKAVPVSLLDKYIDDKKLTERFSKFDMSAFVDNNRNVKWCPAAGCGQAVAKKKTGYEATEEEGLIVECGKGHFFCFGCGSEPHAPLDCTNWKQWRERITELPDSGDSKDESAYLTEIWLLSNTKACPKCERHIQKNEGCNHMTCRKCRYEFCWICMENWSIHGRGTGGYYKCNRFTDDLKSKASGAVASKINNAEQMIRFVHFFERFKNHEQSRQLEDKLLNHVDVKCNMLASLSGKPVEALSFISVSLKELLNCRLILRNSYAYGYYFPSGPEKQVFEQLQEELEQYTEKLSDVVGRKHMRVPRSTIISTSLIARRKRQDFMRAVECGFIPGKRKLQLLTPEEAKVGKRLKVKTKKKKKKKKHERRSSSGSRGRSDSSPAPPARVHVHPLDHPDARFSWTCSECTLNNRNTRRCEACDFMVEQKNVVFDEETRAVDPTEGIDALLRRMQVTVNRIEERRGRLSPSADVEEEDGGALASINLSLPWICSRCTFQNDGGRVCSVCDHQRTDRELPLESSRASVGSADATRRVSVRSFEGEEWSCGVCTYSNENHAQACFMCATPKGGEFEER